MSTSMFKRAAVTGTAFVALGLTGAALPSVAMAATTVQAPQAQQSKGVVCRYGRCCRPWVRCCEPWVRCCWPGPGWRCHPPVPAPGPNPSLFRGHPTPQRPPRFDVRHH